MKFYRTSNYIRYTAALILLVLLSGFPPCSPTAYAVEGLVDQKIDKPVITVGGPDADIPGYTSRAIQIAADAIQARGVGGTIRLSPGRFELTAPVRLYSDMELVGSGEKTILHKVDGFRTSYIIDADYGMLKVTVDDPSGFETGMGILLYDEKQTDCWDATTARITSIDGNVLYIDNYLVRDYRADFNGIISNTCSLVEGVEVEDVRIADFVVNGNNGTNDVISGCLGGGIYLHRARNCLVENVTVTNFSGDSFSWQTTENITIRNCESSYAANLGFHPGTGSDSSIIENCRSHHNGGDGIFLCWRVQNGIIRNNISFSNEGAGISIGHKDTDNIFENNHLYENRMNGVLFRNENEENGGHRNTFRYNLIENNGTSSSKAYGFYIGGVTHDIVIDSNTIRSTGKGNQIGAIFIGPNASRIEEKNNTISGHPVIVK